ncbi:lysophospholipid acyltransferase [Hamiltosporidium magnivora]|uniref:Lysophospholipid acyltransferase n=1 Tax=Hamiltosporidium magnivora TaxID=148818 RepID=A0A4Q9L741_9MICR|nr:lysophospholipid acyltransferase [Hamiltosporidium magnivora]
MNKIVEMPEFRYILALFLTYFITFGLKLTKRTNLFPLFSLCCILIAFGIIDVIFFLVVVFSNISALYLFKRTERIRFIMTGSNILGLLLYQQLNNFIKGIYGERLGPNISGPLMMLVIKMYYLGKEYDFSTHTIYNLISYIFYLPSILVGPAPSFKGFIEKPKQTKKYILFSLRVLMESFIFMGLHLLIRSKFSVEKMLEMQKSNFFKNFLFLYVFSFGFRCKYYFVWTFAHSVFLLDGYTNQKNIFPLSVEFSTNIKGVTDSWNICTNKWLKDCVFVPLKGYSIFMASLATFFVSAIWHGLNWCYFLMFLSFGLIIPFIRNNIRIYKKYLNDSICKFVCLFQMMAIVSYFSVPFITLDLDKTFSIWKNVNFYGHIFVLLSGFGMLLS